MRTLLILAFVIAIRLRGTVEVSPDGQQWEPIIRNRAWPGYARTWPDSFAQIKTRQGVCTLGPDTVVNGDGEALRLQGGVLGLQGRARVLTLHGPVESTDPTTVAVILAQDPVVVEVYEGWVRLGGREDVDEGERAFWSQTGVTRADATLEGVPLELRPRDD